MSTKVRKGSTIIEVLIAATLIATAVLASLSLGSTSQKQTDFSRDLNTATEYNNQALDYLRSMRQTLGYQSLVNEIKLDLGSPTGTIYYCLPSLPSSVTEFANVSASPCDVDDASDLIDGTPFMRELAINLPTDPTQEMNVVITTYWADKAHKASVEATLTEW